MNNTYPVERQTNIQSIPVTYICLIQGAAMANVMLPGKSRTLDQERC